MLFYTYIQVCHVNCNHSVSELRLLLCDIDHLVPLDKLNILLQLFHLSLHPLFASLLRGRVCHHAQTLVLVMELLPVLLQTSQQHFSEGEGGFNAALAYNYTCFKVKGCIAYRYNIIIINPDFTNSIVAMDYN